MHNFVSVDEVEKRCNELSIEESNLQSELETLLQFDDHLEHCVKRLNKKIPNAEYLSSDSNQLAERINFTAALSQNVSSKVRYLDLAKSRVTQCLQRIGDILDLKYCVDGVHKSLINEDYEKGAAYIHRFLSIDVSVLKNCAEDEMYINVDDKNEMSSSSMDEAFAEFYEAKDKLQEIVRKKFDDAVRDDDVASVERFFKIFPLLNEPEEGLKKFSRYLATKIEDRLVNNALNNGTHISQLTVLFEGIAKIVDIHEPLIETYYGHGKLIFVIDVLQKECDHKSRRIIDDFKLCKNFSSIVATITKSIKVNLSTNSNKIDPREIDQLLSEIMLITCRSGKYFKFITQRAQKDIEILSENNVERETKLNMLTTLIRNCELSHVIEEMNGIYVFLEEYFLKESCSKAVQIDDIDSSGTLTSSMLDDVFFIVNKCIKRSLSGRNMDVLCAIINHSVSVLEASFCDVANERLRYGYPSTASITGAAAALDLSQAYNVIQTGRYLQSYSDVEKAKVLFVIALNNLDAANDYINTLKKNIARDVNKIMEEGTQRIQLQKFESCSADLSSLTTKFQGVIVSGLNQLTSSILKPKIKVWTDAFVAASQSLSEDELLRYEVTGGLRPFTETFIVSADTVLKSMKQSLTSNNYTNLINSFASELTRRFETAITKCQFNKIGGLQLDRELRAIISYLTSLTTWSLRDKFARLNDIAFILSVDNFAEVSDYFKSGEKRVPSRLTHPEIRQYLKQRVEFNSDEIRRLMI